MLRLQLLGVAADRGKGEKEEEGGEESSKGLHGVGPEVSQQHQGPACHTSLSGAGEGTEPGKKEQERKGI